jgi:Tfp pilus assembly protein PilZ
MYKAWAIKIVISFTTGTNCLRILITIRVNCLKTVNEHLNYIKTIRYSARIAGIGVQFDREINSIRLGTDLHDSTKLVQLSLTIRSMDFQSGSTTVLLLLRRR